MRLFIVRFTHPSHRPSDFYVGVFSSRQRADAAIKAVIKADIELTLKSEHVYKQNADYYDIIETELDDISND